MRRPLAVSVAVLVAAACSDPTTPRTYDVARLGADLRADGSRVYVLARIEEQATEPLHVWDHVCWADARNPAAGTVHRVATLRDTITLGADGTARRAYDFEWLEDGTPQSVNHFVASGTWGQYHGAPNLYFYGDKPAVQITVSPQNYTGQGYTMLFLLAGADSLVSLQAMGGGCVGPAPSNDGHNASFYYSRR